MGTDDYRFILRHIARSPLKSLLTALIAMLLIMSLIWLQVTIAQTEDEIKNLYDTMPIVVEFRDDSLFVGHDDVVMDNIISISVMHGVLEDDFIREAYVISGFAWSNIVAPAEDGSFSQENLDTIWEDAGTDIDWMLASLDWYFAVSCLETFISESSRLMAVFQADEAFSYKFADGFDASSFYYNDTALMTPIPVIVHEELMQRRGLELGGIAYLTHATRGLDPFLYTAQIIGVYTGRTAGGVRHDGTRPLVVMPLNALRFLRGDSFTYIGARLEIDPARNHEIADFLERWEVPLARNRIPLSDQRIIPLRFAVFDEEFRLVVTPMERNLELLRILYPIAIVASAVLGMGLSLLFMLQNAKNAAIMRVLGTPKLHTRLTLCVEQLIVTFIGIVLVFGILPLPGIGFSAGYLLLMVLYMSAAIIGSVAGAIIISRKPPLELLQVKE